MNLYKYCEDAMKTAAFPGRGSVVGMSYLGLKMAGEAGELAEAVHSVSPQVEIVKEIGDVLWYVAATIHEFQLPVTMPKGPWPQNSPVSVYDVSTAICIGVGKYTELLGKAMRDEGFGTTAGYLTDPRATKITEVLEQVLELLAILSAKYGKTPQEVADINIAKLKSREARGVVHGDGDNR